MRASQKNIKPLTITHTITHTHTIMVSEENYEGEHACIAKYMDEAKRIHSLYPLMDGHNGKIFLFTCIANL